MKMRMIKKKINNFLKLFKQKANYTIETKEFTDGGLLCEIAPNKNANEVMAYLYTPKPIVQYGESKARPSPLNIKLILEYLPLGATHHEPGILTHRIKVIRESRFLNPKTNTFEGKTLFSKGFDFIGYTNKNSNQIAILSFRGLVDLVKNKTIREIGQINFDDEVQFYRAMYLNEIKKDEHK